MRGMIHEMNKENDKAKLSPEAGLVKLPDRSNKKLLSYCNYLFIFYFGNCEKDDLLSHFQVLAAFK
jgi:hypothetical protein